MLTTLCAILCVIACACCFIVPPLWLDGANLLSVRTRVTYTGLLVSLLVIASSALYWKLGNYAGLKLTRTAEYLGEQQNIQLVRPMYAALQRDLVKYDLNITIDIKNVELILTFAHADSQARDGVLSKDVQKLLYGVLNAIPNQVTALNLLAVHAYKNAQYAEAIAHWQAILQQFPEHLIKSEVYTILQAKIADTKLKLVNQRKTT